jgi:hypothetical protein
VVLSCVSTFLASVLVKKNRYGSLGLFIYTTFSPFCHSAILHTFLPFIIRLYPKFDFMKKFDFWPKFDLITKFHFLTKIDSSVLMKKNRYGSLGLFTHTAFSPFCHSAI